MHNGCILKGGVGTGKSRTALAYYFLHVAGGTLPINGAGDWGEFRRPLDIYVITTAKKRDDLDWEEEARHFNISTSRSQGFGNVQIKVDSWNNILAYADVKDAFFIFDEQRLVGSGAWVKAFYKIAAANKWIMLSATPGDNWLDYIPVLVANGHYKNRTQFIRRHVVYNNFSKFPKVDHYVETGRLDRLRREILVDMPFSRHTIRHVENIVVDYNQALFDRAYKERWHVYEERPLKDVGEMFIVLRRIVNSDPSRLGALMALLEKHPRLIVFYNFNYELEALRALAENINYPKAEWNGHRHQDIPEGDKWLYLVQYTAGAEGWNCVQTNATVFYSLNYSYKINEQAKGRIDRMDTEHVDLYYYVMRSPSMIDLAIAKSLRNKKNFNEKALVKQW